MNTNISFSDYQNWGGILPIFPDEAAEGWTPEIVNKCAVWKRGDYMIVRQFKSLGDTDARLYNLYQVIPVFDEEDNKIGDNARTLHKDEDGKARAYDTFLDAVADCE